MGGGLYLLLDVQLIGPDAVEDLGGLGGRAVGLDQQVLVEVPHPAADLQPGVRGRAALGLQLQQLLQGTVGPLGERRELMSAGLLVTGHRADGHRWRTSRHDGDGDTGDSLAPSSHDRHVGDM